MNQFKRFYLVCLDHGDDINYVVARNPSLGEAETAAEEARKNWPGKDVYITVEKIPVNNPLNMGLNYSYTKPNPASVCLCGRQSGECVGNLHCKCNPLANCKRVDQHEINPMDYESQYLRKNPKLSPATMEIISVKRVIEVKIPEWSDEIFGLPPSDLSPDVRQEIKPGSILQISVNLDASQAEDLIIQNPKLLQQNPSSNEEYAEDYYNYSPEE